MEQNNFASSLVREWARAVIMPFAVGLVGMIAFAVPLVAQDTLQVADRPGSHIVREGETLWGLAGLYLGDPFLWPEIYRLNTMVVEDPHWIFPGEELLLSGADRTAVAVGEPELPPGEVEAQQRVPDAPPVELPAAPPPPPTEQMAPTVFATAAPTAGPSLTIGPTERYRAVRRGAFYGAGFLTESEDLPWAEVMGPAVGASEAGRYVGASAMLFERISIRAPQGATYHVGDSLLTVELKREVPGGWGRVVLPTGIARVVHVSGQTAIAEVTTQYGRVLPGQAAMPVEPFRNPGSTRPQAVLNGATGSIITVRDLTWVPGQQSIVFIDLGRQGGVVPGDVFEVIAPGSVDASVDAPPRRIALMQIVHVRERSASGLVLQIADLGIEEGAVVRLIGKMPS